MPVKTSSKDAGELVFLRPSPFSPSKKNRRQRQEVGYLWEVAGESRLSLIFYFNEPTGIIVFLNTAELLLGLRFFLASTCMQLDQKNLPLIQHGYFSIYLQYCSCTKPFFLMK